MLCYRAHVAQAHDRVSGANDHLPASWPGGSAPLQPCRHVLDGLPFPLVMHVSRCLACGSHAAAPAVLTIQRVVHRYSSWSRGCWICLCRSSSRSGMNALPARRRVVAIGSCLRTSGHGQHLTAVKRMPPHRLEACATDSLCHGKHLQPDLTQQDVVDCLTIRCA
ncbi:MAG: hypothetical protein KatS3mg054_1259 [Chloroflexus sp.]|nr:MAG: hypothetical protein KatS3mg054_1259 [Chloroflexus sp.]